MGSLPRRHGPEGLRVYDLALQFADRLEDLLSQARCSASLRDQLQRAAESAILNIAEGAGHVAPGRKTFHYQLAHGSLAECLGGLQIVKRRNPALDVQRLRRTADMASVMLTALIRRYQKP